MNKNLLAVFLLVTSFGFAEEKLPAPQTLISEEIQELSIKPVAPESLDQEMNVTSFRKGTIYFRAIADSEANQQAGVLPGLGIGYRRTSGHSGFDASINYSAGSGWGTQHKQIFWTAPKVSYLYYFAPLQDASLYSGMGFSWGGIQDITYTEDTRDTLVFMGLIPHITIGYEMLRQSLVSSFIELTVNQALIPSQFYGSTIPGPIAELSLGAGF